MNRFVFIVTFLLLCATSLRGQNLCVKCTTPDTESSQATRHSVYPGFGTAEDFVQSLVFITNPTSVDTGAIIVEAENATGTDGCWFNGSIFPPYMNITGGQWTVGVQNASTPDGSVTFVTANQWGPDTVGYSDAVATYYWSNLAKLSRQSCGFHWYQNLTIECPGQLTTTFEFNVNLTDTISPGGGQSCRENACGPLTPL